MSKHSRQILVGMMLTFIIYLSVITPTAQQTSFYVPQSNSGYYLMFFLLFLPVICLYFALKSRAIFFRYFPLGWSLGILLALKPGQWIQGNLLGINSENISFILVIAGFMGIFICYAKFFVDGKS